MDCTCVYKEHTRHQRRDKIDNARNRPYRIHTGTPWDSLYKTIVNGMWQVFMARDGVMFQHSTSVRIYMCVLPNTGLMVQQITYKLQNYERQKQHSWMSYCGVGSDMSAQNTKWAHMCVQRNNIGNDECWVAFFARLIAQWVTCWSNKQAVHLWITCGFQFKLASIKMSCARKGIGCVERT